MVKATTASAVQRIAAESRKVRPGAAVVLSVIGVNVCLLFPGKVSPFFRGMKTVFCKTRLLSIPLPGEKCDRETLPE